MKSIGEMIPEIASETLDKMARGYELSQLLFTACEYGLFTLLTEEKEARQVSQELKTDPAMTEKFLNALTAAGLLIKSNGRYSNTPLADTFLVQGKPFYQGNLLKLVSKGYHDWSKLGQVLKEGAGRKAGERPAKNVFNESFILAMAEGALRGTLQQTVDVISGLPEFAGVKEMLDLGGGHGLYAIALAQKKPDLKAVVFDLPHAVDVTRDFINRYGMQEKVKVIAGDFNRDELGGGYDLVLASDVFYRPKEAVTGVMRKIFESLNDGGIFILKQWMLNDEGTGPLTAVLFDLKLSLSNNQHYLYTTRESIDLCCQVGFKDIQVIDISIPAKPSTLIIARKNSEIS